MDEFQLVRMGISPDPEAELDSVVKESLGKLGFETRGNAQIEQKFGGVVIFQIETNLVFDESHDCYGVETRGFTLITGNEGPL
jgi:hypothetical protein